MNHWFIAFVMALLAMFVLLLVGLLLAIPLATVFAAVMKLVDAKFGRERAGLIFGSLYLIGAISFFTFLAHDSLVRSNRPVDERLGKLKEFQRDFASLDTLTLYQIRDKSAEFETFIEELVRDAEKQAQAVDELKSQLGDIRSEKISEEVLLQELQHTKHDVLLAAIQSYSIDQYQRSQYDRYMDWIVGGVVGLMLAECYAWIKRRKRTRVQCQLEEIPNENKNQLSK